MRKRLIVIILVFSILPLLSFANPVQQQTIQNFFNQWRIKNEIPGASVSIYSPHANFEITSGTIQLNGKKSICPSSLFGVGSITKMFVSVMILKLEAQGKLNIQDRLGLYLLQYPKWKNITIKQLLNMTSGIPNFDDNEKFNQDMNTNPLAHWTPNQLIDVAYRMPTPFLPGHGWKYSNTNYLLLGEIIETVTKMPLASILETQLFKPLQLKNTYYSDTVYPTIVRQQMAHGYYNSLDMTNVAPSNYGAAGAAFMNTKDLTSWVTHLFIKQAVLPRKQLLQMLTGVPVPFTKMRPPHTQYGLGVFISQNQKLGRMIWYTGVIQGYSSVFVWIPRKSTLIVAQINRWRGTNFTLLFPNQALIKGLLRLIKVD